MPRPPIELNNSAVYIFRIYSLFYRILHIFVLILNGLNCTQNFHPGNLEGWNIHVTTSTVVSSVLLVVLVVTLADSTSIFPRLLYKCNKHPNPESFLKIIAVNFKTSPGQNKAHLLRLLVLFSLGFQGSQGCQGSQWLHQSSPSHQSSSDWFFNTCPRMTTASAPLHVWVGSATIWHPHSFTIPWKSG